MICLPLQPLVVEGHVATRIETCLSPSAWIAHRAGRFREGSLPEKGVCAATMPLLPHARNVVVPEHGVLGLVVRPVEPVKVHFHVVRRLDRPDAPPVGFRRRVG